MLLSCVGASTSETRRLITSDSKFVHSCQEQQDATVTPRADGVDVRVRELRRCAKGTVDTQQVRITRSEQPPLAVMLVDLGVILGGAALLGARDARPELRYGVPLVAIPVGTVRLLYDLSLISTHERVELFRDDSRLKRTTDRGPAPSRKVHLRLPDGRLVTGTTAEDGWVRLMLPEDANQASGLTALLVTGGVRKRVSFPPRAKPAPDGKAPEQRPAPGPSNGASK